jgi:hypothetical protein
LAQKEATPVGGAQKTLRCIFFIAAIMAIKAKPD